MGVGKIGNDHDFGNTFLYPGKVSTYELENNLPGKDEAKRFKCSKADIINVTRHPSSWSTKERILVTQQGQPSSRRIHESSIFTTSFILLFFCKRKSEAE